MRYKDNLSDSRIEFRLTAEEKEKIRETAASMNMTVSEFIRYACEKIFDKDKNTNI